MKLTKTLSACLAAAGLLLAGSIGHAQPVVGNVYPDGKYLFEPTNTLTFSATAAANITNVTVQLTGNRMAGGSPLLRVLSNGSGLNVTGLSTTSISASGVLNSNYLYTAIIKVTDANGVSTTSNLSFSTLAAYTFEAEDFDYTSNGVGGLFIDNPQTNAYAGRASTSGVDYVNNVNQGNADYRPQGMETEGLGSDTPRQQYGNGLSDYDVGWNNGNGGWGNYTRHYPAGTYNIFVRGSNGNGPANPYCADLSVVGGTGSFSGTGPFTFLFPTTGWSSYTWAPILDASKNPAQITFDGSASTLRVNTDGGNFNANFYMLVPVPTNTQASTVVLTNIYPDGTFQFQRTNQLTFTANSTAGMNTGDILVQLTGTTLAGQSSTVLLTTANGLVATGSANSWSVSYSSLSNDMVYSAFIQVMDVNGGVTSTTVKFDTVSPTYYTFEAEDFNYGGGQYFDNPQTNAYQDAHQTGQFDGVSGVDYTLVNQNNGSYAYGRLGLTTENPNPFDVPRLSYTSGLTNPATGLLFEDFDCGNSAGGNWGNYTRTFPAGTYNVYMRGASGNSANQADSASMYLVTSSPSAGSQTTSKLGTFSVPGTGGWQSYQWVPLLNSAGNPVQFTGGSVKTLRVTTDNGGYNANYYMLVPADTSVHTPPFVTDVQPDGTTIFQLSSALTFTANSAAGITGSGVSVTLNGVSANAGLTFGGTANALTVNCPLQSNTLYTAVITVTDSYGTTSSTNKFDTFDPNSYQFEAEDYDYTSGGVAGLFIDGGINQYNGLPSTEDVDEHDDGHANGVYRASNGSTSGQEIETAGDVVRPAFNGYTDYNIGFNDGGNWANYTHNYPAGTYNVYMRSANPNTPPGVQVNAATLSIVTGGWNTTGQTTTQLGSFNVPYSGGWHTFAWAPMMDANGNLARVTLNGSTNTLRATVAGGNYNVNFYALVPADMSIPILNNVYPNGAYQFQATNQLSFGASSSAGINGSGVSVQLIGTNLLGQAFVTNITTANGLVVSGPATSITATLPLALNAVYTAIITVTTANGHTVSSTVSFDTVSPTYLFEAEDFNYNGGLFLAGAQTNGYLNLNGVAGIDANQTSYNAGSPSVYRTNALINVETASDVARAARGGLQDYDVGNNLGGNWQNYTRNFPVGIYNVYLRGAGGNNIGGIFTNVASLGVVTGATTTNQINSLLGTFNLAPKGWQVYSDLPLIDADGNYAQFVSSGQQTLRLTTDNGNYNANYLFLLPADTTLPVNPPHLKAAASGANVVVSFLSRTNTTYQLLFKTNLTDPAWTPVGSTISGNSLNISVTNITGTSGFYRLQTN